MMKMETIALNAKLDMQLLTMVRIAFHFRIDINQPENHKSWVKNQILGSSQSKMCYLCTRKQLLTT